MSKIKKIIKILVWPAVITMTAGLLLYFLRRFFSYSGQAADEEGDPSDVNLDLEDFEDNAQDDDLDDLLSWESEELSSREQANAAQDEQMVQK